MSWWNGLWTARAQDWTTGYLDASQVFDQLARTTVQPNSAYISVFLRAMRVVRVRTGLKKFYGAVHSFITVPHLFGPPAKFHLLTTPASLCDIDAVNIDRIITIDKRLLGPVPYRGGDVEMEIGLFSIESVNLAQPFLAVLESLSQAAGVSYVNAAAPFIGPLLQGINLLAGTGDGSILEIGLSRNFQKVETGTLIIMRAPHGSIRLADLRVAEDYHLVDAAGNPIQDYPYMVIAIQADPQRDDWFNIPELALAYKDLQQALRIGRHNDTQEALAVFKRLALTCPDLLDQHAKKLCTLVENEINEKLKFVPTAAKTMEVPELSQLNIFG